MLELWMRSYHKKRWDGGHLEIPEQNFRVSIASLNRAYHPAVNEMHLFEELAAYHAKYMSLGGTKQDLIYDSENTNGTYLKV